MSKFLKFIVHIVVISTIVCVLGLAVPPFFGVNTVIIDNANDATNMPLGSVTYAIPKKATEVLPGETILVNHESEGKRYKYVISSLNLENNTAVVIDPSSTDSKQINVKIQDYIPSIVATIPFVGYLLVATESVEGLIILGLAVLFLIILYIIAELWKRDPEDDEDDEIEDTEPGYVKSKKELKKEEKAREKRFKEEERQIRAEEKGKKKNKKEAKRKIKTGGFVDEIEDDEEEEEIQKRPAKSVRIQNAASEAHEELKKEMREMTASAQREGWAEKEVAEDNDRFGNTQMIVEEVRRAFGEEDDDDEDLFEDENAAESLKLAIPLWSLKELKQHAKEDGDEPEVFEDEITKITLLDYSDIIGDDDEEEEE